MSERRKHPRGRCLVGAEVVYNGRASTMSCTLRNQSEEGGLLIFGEAPNIPEQFNLSISNRQSLVPAHVVWRSGLKVGVAFETSLSQSGLRMEAAQHLNGLMAERATLRFH